MKPISEKPAVADHHAIAAELRRLSAFASWAVLEDGAGRRVHTERKDSAVQRALRELMRQHGEAPPTTLEAHAAAWRVLHEHDGEAAFARWERRGGGMSRWPTSDGLETRVRAVAIDPQHETT